MIFWVRLQRLGLGPGWAGRLWLSLQSSILGRVCSHKKQLQKPPVLKVYRRHKESCIRCRHEDSTDDAFSLLEQATLGPRLFLWLVTAFQAQW